MAAAGCSGIKNEENISNSQTDGEENNESQSQDAKRNTPTPPQESEVEINEEFYGSLTEEFPFLQLSMLSYVWFHFIFSKKTRVNVRSILKKIHDNLDCELKAIKAGKAYAICPKLHDLWRWTDFCNPEEVKVVILGQDPYHNYEFSNNKTGYVMAATGCGFSIDTEYFDVCIRGKPVDKIYSPSFKNIINLVYDGKFENYLKMAMEI